MTCRIGRFVSLLTLVVAAALATLQPVSGFGETLRFVWAADSRVDSPPKDPKLVDLINKPVLDAINRGIRALSPRPSFMVFGGDMAYRGKYKGQWTFDTWIGVMKPLTDAEIPIYTTLGNHELYQHPDTAWSFNLENQQQFQQTFTTNPSNGPPGYERLAYSFTSPGGDAFFAVLDPYFLTDNANPANLTGKIDDIQLAWLESQVAQTKATHKFLFIHTPYYYVSAPPPVPDVSFTRLWQIVDTHHFDVYFCGHSHLFSRKTIDSSILPNPPLPGPIRWKNNVVQLLNGAAGAGPDTGPLSVDKDLWHVANDAHTYYFTVVDIDEGRVTVTSYKGDTADYAAFDQFTIPEVKVIPTLSEWGMILLALSLLTVGTWQVTGRPALLGVAPTAGGALLCLAAEPLLRSVLVGELVAGMGLVVYGRLIAPVAAHDILGAGLAGLLLGTMIECSRRGRGR